MPRRGKTRPADLLVTERRAYVFRLKQAGATYADIARTIHSDAAWRARLPQHYTEREAYRDVMKELQRLREDLGGLVDQVRSVELARLDRLHLAYWQRAIGDPAHQVPGDIEAARFILQLMQRRARYLPGLEGPEAPQIDLTVVLQQSAQRVAEEFGLTPQEVLAEAQALLALPAPRRGEDSDGAAP